MKHLYELHVATNREKAVLTSVEESVVAFSEITGIPASFYSPEGELLWEYNEECKLCSANNTYSDEQSHCRHTLKSAMNIALGLGEEYIFLCDSGLINLAHALTGKSSVFGYVVAGPIPMGTNREKAVRHFCEKMPSDNVDFPLLMSILSGLRMYTPAEITHLMKLFSNIFESLNPGESLTAVNRQKSVEQSNVVSKIIEMKRSNIELAYPVASENELLRSISNGDSSTGMRNLSKYVEDLMVFENGDLSIIKLRLLSLFGQLTRESGKGAPASSEYEILSALESLNNAGNFKELMNAAGEFVLSMSETIFSDMYSGDSEVVAKALAYIHNGYSGQLSLASIAGKIHISSSYLSTLFKRETGLTVSAYIKEFRLSNAEKKLRSSAQGITDISLSCGFESPSYFTKLFKEKYGQTPRQYRASR